MRHSSGSVVLDKRSNTYNFFWWEDGKRKSKALGKFPTKAAAWKAARTLRQSVENRLQPVSESPQVSSLVERYMLEKMPKRSDTIRTYTSWLKFRILPKWGMCALTDMQARPVELWLQSLPLAPKSKAHIRGLLRLLWDYAMWAGDIPTQRNPIELVTVLGATKRLKKPRSLSADEFQKFIAKLADPFRTLALLSVCFGLRISEALGLKWGDIDWLNGTIRIERGIVAQRVEDTKTAESHRTMKVDSAMLEILKLWKQSSQFTGQSDWIFASPIQLGRLPYSYRQICRVYSRAGKQAGIGHISTHVLRHTYRSWLDAVGTSVGVQQKMMRHADIRTTMNIYGDVVTDEMVQAGSKVASLALIGRGTAGSAS